VTTTFVDGATPVMHATVHMTERVRGALPSSVGKTIVAGWKRDRTRMTRVRVDVIGIEVLNPLKPVTPALDEAPVLGHDGPGLRDDAMPVGGDVLSLGGAIQGWQMFIEVNGDWREAPGLSKVSTPGLIPEKKLPLLRLAPRRRHAASAHDRQEPRVPRVAALRSSLARSLALYGLTTGRSVSRT